MLQLRLLHRIGKKFLNGLTMRKNRTRLGFKAVHTEIKILDKDKKYAGTIVGLSLKLQSTHSALFGTASLKLI